MRVLITRAEPDATATAARVAALGHQPIIVPLSRIEAAPRPSVVPGCDVVLATSLNGLRHGPLEPFLPTAGFAVVGDKCAQHVLALGGRLACAPAASAADLAARVIAGVVPGARLLYLAGEPRKPALEERLSVAGYGVTVLPTYRVVAAERLPAEIATALAAGTIDAVLHYSREGAARFYRLAAGPGQGKVRLRHACLSDDVAAGLTPCAGCDVRVAASPDERALLALLDVFC